VIKAYISGLRNGLESWMPKLDAYLLRIHGRVQRVGFRRFILDSAHDLGLNGYAKNVADGSIEVLVQGDEPSLQKFIDSIRHPQSPAEIKTIEEKNVLVDPSMQGFRLLYGELGDELQEGFGAMQSAFSEYRSQFQGFSVETMGSFKLILEKYGEISAKMTTILETLTRESAETKQMLNESMKALRETLDRIGTHKNT
jgi:acylphosphatase